MCPFVCVWEGGGRGESHALSHDTAPSDSPAIAATYARGLASAGGMHRLTAPKFKRPATCKTGSFFECRLGPFCHDPYLSSSLKPHASVKSLNKFPTSRLQGCCYSCVVATPDSRALYVVGSDKKLKELEEVGGTGTQVTKELDTGTTVNSIALPAGTAMLQYIKSCLSILMDCNKGICGTAT